LILWEHKTKRTSTHNFSLASVVATKSITFSHSINGVSRYLTGNYRPVSVSSQNAKLHGISRYWVARTNKAARFFLYRK